MPGVALGEARLRRFCGVLRAEACAEPHAQRVSKIAQVRRFKLSVIWFEGASV